MFGFGVIASLDHNKLTKSMMIVIAFIIMFEFSTGFIEFILGSSSLYMRMVQKIYKELMMMGIISFILTMYEAVQDDLSDNKHDWLQAVDVAHYFLFYLAIFFVCHAIYLIRLSIITSNYYNSYTLASVEDSLVALKALSNDWFQRFVYMVFPTQLRFKTEFKLIQLLFSDAYDVPTEFDYAAYLSSCYARYAFKIIDIGLFEWSVVIAVVTVNYLRIKFHGSFNCNYHYGPDYGVYSKDGTETDDHRRLASTTDDHHNDSDTDCLINNYIFFVIMGFLLLIYVFALSFTARIYERKVYHRVGLKDQSLEERIKFFEWLNSQQSSKDEAIEEVLHAHPNGHSISLSDSIQHPQSKVHPSPPSSKDKHENRRASVSIFKNSSKVKGDSNSQLHKIRKLKDRIVLFQDTYEVNEEREFFIEMERTMRQLVDACRDFIYRCRLGVIRSCRGSAGKQTGKVTHDPVGVVTSRKHNKESNKPTDIEDVRESEKVSVNNRKALISDSLQQLRRSASTITHQKMMKTLEDDEEVRQVVSDSVRDKFHGWTDRLSSQLSRTFSMSVGVDRTSKLEKTKDVFFRRKKSVILSYINQFQTETERKTLHDPDILVNNIQSIFLFGNKLWFDKAVEIGIILHCLYLSLWAMNFITTIKETHIPMHNQIIIVVPILLIGMTLGHIIQTLSVLDAVCNLNLDAMKSVIEDTEDTINMIDSLRKDIDEGINQLADANVTRLQLIEELFLQIDEDKSGYIDRLEFRNLLRQLELCYTEDRFNRLFNWVDFDGSGKINFEEVHDLLLGQPAS